MCVVVVSWRVRSHAVLLRNPDTDDEVWDEWARYASQPSHVRDVYTCTCTNPWWFYGARVTRRLLLEAVRDDRQNADDWSWPSTLFIRPLTDYFTGRNEFAYVGWSKGWERSRRIKRVSRFVQVAGPYRACLSDVSADQCLDYELECLGFERWIERWIFRYFQVLDGIKAKGWSIRTLI